MILFIALGVLVLIALYVLATYNSFAGMRVRIKASIQEIGNQLKRQANLIPNLESSAKAYLKHEKDIFTSLTEARKAVGKAQNSGKLTDIEKASDAVSALVPKLQVIVESNPEIKGAEVVRQLMDELRDTADKLMYSRRTVIDLTADYNTMLVQFPSSLVASMFSFSEEAGLSMPSGGDYLKVSEAETKNPEVRL